MFEEYVENLQFAIGNSLSGAWGIDQTLPNALRHRSDRVTGGSADSLLI
jgi:hypothetical protein